MTSPYPPGYPPQGPEGPQGYGPRGPSDDHLWAALSYVLAFVASIIAPLVIYLVKMNESRFVRFHAAQSLNMGISAVIYTVAIILVGILAAIATHGFGFLLVIPLFIAFGVAHLVFLIMAAVKAGQGQLYRVPAIICIPMVR
jgi:hypothetical protein